MKAANQIFEIYLGAEIWVFFLTTPAKQASIRRFESARLVIYMWGLYTKFQPCCFKTEGGDGGDRWTDTQYENLLFIKWLRHIVVRLWRVLYFSTYKKMHIYFIVVLP